MPKPANNSLYCLCTAITISHIVKLEPGLRSDHGSLVPRFWPGRVGSWVTACDLVLSFNMRVYHGIVSTE